MLPILKWNKADEGNLVEDQKPSSPSEDLFVSLVLGEPSINQKHQFTDALTITIKHRFCNTCPRPPTFQAESDAQLLQKIRRLIIGGLFQSTHPIRSATATPTPSIPASSNFNPRTPYRVRRA